MTSVVVVMAKTEPDRICNLPGPLNVPAVHEPLPIDRSPAPPNAPPVMVSEPLIVEAVATARELPVTWSGAEQTKEFNVTGLTAELNKTVVAVVMVTSSPLAGTPLGFQLAASDQLPVPAPPSHTTGAGT